MAVPRLLGKLMATTAKLSAGAVNAGVSRSGPPGSVPEIVPKVIRLLAETITSTPQPGESDLRQIEEQLAALVEHYGTMRLAIEALGAGRRRFPSISHDKARIWDQAINATVGGIEATLRKNPAVLLHVTKWCSNEGEGCEQALDQYLTWLEGPLPARTAPVDPAVGSPPAQEAATTRAPAPEAAGSDPEEVFELVPTAPGARSAPPSASPARPADMEHVRWALLAAKPLGDPPGAGEAPRISSAEKEAAERLSGADSALAQATGCLALGRFAEAGKHLDEMKGHGEPADVLALRGERLFFEGRFDEAADAFRSAGASRDDLLGRLSLAAALLRSHKAPVEASAREAIELLGEALGRLSKGAPGRGRTAAMLGFGWLHLPVGDRDANVRRAIENLEAGLGEVTQENEPQLWAQVHALLGAAWQALPTGKLVENIQRAITCFTRAEQFWTKESDPDRWATLQNSLGHAWERLPTGHRAVNLEKAIRYFTAALAVRTRERQPVSWATLQNNLGNAWVQLPVGDHRQNITRAIECHEGALKVWSAEERRGEWAATQNNLGNAWALLPAGGEEREKNLRRAVASYKQALEVRTRSASPADWATTQNNLGSALLHMPGSTGGPGAPLREAIACFQRALEVRTREAFPLDWAKTQANLGHAWARLGDGDRAANLQSAAECYAQALGVFKAGEHPHLCEHVRAKLHEVQDKIDELKLMQ